MVVLQPSRMLDTALKLTKCKKNIFEKDTCSYKYCKIVKIKYWHLYTTKEWILAVTPLLKPSLFRILLASYLFGFLLWMLDSEHWTLEAGLWRLDSGLWTLDSGGWTLEAGLWTLDPEHWTLKGPWTLDSGCWTLESGRWALDTAMDTVADCSRTESEPN